MKFKEFIFEMAMESGNGLALLQYGNAFLILFNPTKSFYDTILKDELDENSQIYGIIALRNNTLYKSTEVTGIWATSGYGPLMYLLAMSSACNYGLMPTRIHGQVSNEAKNVWKNFYNGLGKHLVISQKLNSDHNHHDELYLNMKYNLKSCPYKDYNTMLSRGKIFFNGNQELIERLVEFSDGLLEDKLADIY